nr:putative integron gene cassette protein [uncultured bacterium]
MTRASFKFRWRRRRYRPRSFAARFFDGSESLLQRLICLSTHELPG